MGKLFRFLINWITFFGMATVGSTTYAAVPDKLVVLTFDDSVASHFSTVAPILKQYGFSATFFITEGFSFRTNKSDYMTWEQIAALHRDGFEIGNHTRDHLGVNARTLDQLAEQIEAINARCREHGIPAPTSFAYPGNSIDAGALPILKRLGIRLARRGGAPEYPYEGGQGFAFEPGLDDPLLIPSAGDARPHWTLADFVKAVRQARHGKIAVLQFHGVPDREHPWVNTLPDRFAQYMDYLHRNGYRGIALRDVLAFPEVSASPSKPLAIIEQRKTVQPKLSLVRGQIVDAQSGLPVASRLYIKGPGGMWHFPDSASVPGTARLYQRRNWINTNAVEMHTTLSAHPFEIELPPGRYLFTAERGKEYFPEIRELTIGEEPVELRMAIRRWIDMASRGWFGGDTHVHRDPSDLPNVMLAEDLNVAFPLVYWTTDSEVPPNRSARNLKVEAAPSPVTIDATHVFYPRNTEYEIFTVSKRSHTLGALLLLDHQTVFDLPALPVSRIATRAHAEGALLDLDKHNWPWSIALVPIVRPDLFELANNHHWATTFSITNWAEPAPDWMNVKNGSENERQWTLYGFKTFYALLNCGFSMTPSAGTANGVHPVPLGFSRVYVHLPNGFSYQTWKEGLKAGRSFVTTGPMLFATADGESYGARFQSKGKRVFQVHGEVISSEPIQQIEIIVNGEVALAHNLVSEASPNGAHRAEFKKRVAVDGSGWIAVRCWEERDAGRFRFAHGAPWFVEASGQPLRPRREEVDFLLKQTEQEIARSKALLPAEALEEYRRAADEYRAIARSAR